MGITILEGRMYSLFKIDNFLISGNAVEWYFRSQDNNYKSHCCHPFNRCMCKNWGSIAGGAFLHAFFTPFDIFSEAFRVKMFLFSVIQEEIVLNVPIYIDLAVAANMSLNLSVVMHTPILI